MVNNSGSVPPPNQGGKPEDIKPEHSKPESGSFHFSKARDFLGMHFTAKEWNKLMNILLKNMNSFIQKTYQKAIKKMKEDWQKEKEG